MDWNVGEIEAAKAALATINEAIDTVTLRASQLESLLALLAAAADEIPQTHRENVCALGAELASEIRAAAGRLS